MIRRLSSPTASETAGTGSQRRSSIAPSRCSLGRPNSSPSPWYTSSGNRVSLASITIMSPCRPLSISGNLSGITYPTSVSSSIIPRTQTRLVSAASTAWPARGVGNSAPRVCRALRAAEDAEVASGSGGSIQTSLPTAIQPLARVVPSQGRLAYSRSSSCGASHAFLRKPSRINVSRIASRKSNPVIAERTRITESLKRRGSVGRPCPKRALFLDTDDADSGGRATGKVSLSTTLNAAAGTAHINMINETPQLLISTEINARVEGRPILTAPDVRSESSADEVGKALFSDWPNRKKEMFADVFKDKKDFFADLIKQRAGEERMSTTGALKIVAPSSHSEMFMTTISEMVEKDVADTSAENYTTQSLTGPSITASVKTSMAKESLQVTAGLQKTASSDFDSYELSKTLESGRGADTRTDEFFKGNIQTAPESPSIKSIHPDSSDSQFRQPETEPEVPMKEQGGSGPFRDTSTDLLIPYTESEDKRERQLEVTSGEQQYEDKKSAELVPAPSLTFDGTSVRAEATTEASGYVAEVPALAESTLEVPGATSEVYQPDRFARSLVSEMTEFPVFDVSKTQDADAATNLPLLPQTDDNLLKTQLTERSKTPEYSQPQDTDAFPKLYAKEVSSSSYPHLLPMQRDVEEPKAAVVASERTLSNFTKSEVFPHAFSEERRGHALSIMEFGKAEEVKSHDQLLFKQTEQNDSSEAENLLLRKPGKESEIRDMVEIKEDQAIALTSEEITTVDATATDKPEATLLGQYTAAPSEEGRLKTEDLKKETWDTVPIQQTEESELIPSTQALDASVMEVSGDVLLSQGTIVIPADASLTAQEQENERDTQAELSKHEDKGSDFMSYERTEIPGVAGTEKYESFQMTEHSLATAGDDFPEAEEAEKKLETLDTVLKRTDQDVDLRKPIRTTDITVAEKTGDLPQIEQIITSDTVETDQTGLTLDIDARKPDQSTELVSAKSPETPVTAASTKIEDGLFLQDILGHPPALTTFKKKSETDLTAPKSGQSRDKMPTEGSESTETISAANAEEGMFTQEIIEYTIITDQRKQSDIRDAVKGPSEEGSEPFSSEQPETVDTATGVQPDQAIQYAPTTELLENGEIKDIISREQDLSSQMVSSESPEYLKKVEATKYEERLFPRNFLEYTKPVQSAATIASESPEAAGKIKAETPEEGPFPLAITEPETKQSQIEKKEEAGIKPDRIVESVSLERPQAGYVGTEEKPQQIIEYSPATDHPYECDTKNTEDKKTGQSLDRVPYEPLEASVTIAAAKLSVFPDKITQATELRNESSLESTETEYVDRAGKQHQDVEYAPAAQPSEEGEIKEGDRQPDQNMEIVPSESIEEFATTQAEKPEEGPFPPHITEHTSSTQQNESAIIGRELEEAFRAVSSERPETENLDTARKPQQIGEYTHAKQPEDEIMDIESRKPDQNIQIYPSGRLAESETIKAAKHEEGLFPQQITEYTLTKEQRKESEVKDIIERESQAAEAVSLERSETELVDTARQPQHTVEHGPGTEHPEDEVKDTEYKKPGQSMEIVPSEGLEESETFPAAKHEAELFPQQIPEYTLLPEQRKESEVKDITERESEAVAAAVFSESPETEHVDTAGEPQQTVEHGPATEHPEDEVKDTEYRKPGQRMEIVPSEGLEKSETILAAKQGEGLFPQQITDYTLSTEQRKESEVKDITRRESEDAAEAVSLERPERKHVDTAEKSQEIVEYAHLTEQPGGDVEDTEHRKHGQSMAIIPHENLESETIASAKHEEGLFPQQIAEYSFSPEHRKEIEVKDIIERKSEEAAEAVFLERPETEHVDTTETPQEIVGYAHFTEQPEGEDKDTEYRNIGQSTEIVLGKSEIIASAKHEEALFPQQIAEYSFSPEHRKEIEVKDIIERKSEEAAEAVFLERPETEHVDTTETPQEIVEYAHFTEQPEGEDKDTEYRNIGQSTEIVLGKSEIIASAKHEEALFPQQIAEYSFSPEHRKEIEVKDIIERKSEEAAEAVFLERPETEHVDTTETPQEIVEYAHFTEQPEGEVKDTEYRKPDQNMEIVPFEGLESETIPAAKHEEGLFPQKIAEDSLSTEQRKESEVKYIIERKSEEAAEAVFLERPEKEHVDTTETPQEIVEYAHFTEQPEGEVKDTEYRKPDQNMEVVPFEGLESETIPAAKHEEGLFPQKIAEDSLSTEQRKESEVKYITERKSEEAAEAVFLERPETEHVDTTETPQEIVEYAHFTEQPEGEVKDTEYRKPDQNMEIVPFEGLESETIPAAKHEEGLFPQQIAEDSLSTEQRKEREVKDIIERKSEEAAEAVFLERPETEHVDTTETPQEIVEYAHFTEQPEGEVKDTEYRKPDQNMEIVPFEGLESETIPAAKHEEGLFPQQIAEDSLSTEQRKESEVKDIIERKSDEAAEAVSLERPEKGHVDTTETPQEIVEYAHFTEQPEGEVKGTEYRKPGESMEIVPSEGLKSETIAPAKREEELFPQQTTDYTLSMEQRKESEVKDIIERESEQAANAVSLEMPDIDRVDTAEKPQEIVEYAHFREQPEGEDKDIVYKKPDESLKIVTSERSTVSEQGKESEAKEINERETERAGEEVPLGRHAIEYEDISGKSQQVTECMPAQHTEAFNTMVSGKYEDELFSPQTLFPMPTAEQQAEGGGKDTVGRKLEESTELLSSQGAHRSESTSSWTLKESLSLQRIVECPYTLIRQKEGPIEDTSRSHSDETSQQVSSEGIDINGTNKIANFEESLFLQQTAEFTSAPIPQIKGAIKGSAREEPQISSDISSSENLESTHTTNIARLKDDLLPRRVDEYKSYADEEKGGYVTGMVPGQSNQSSELVPYEDRETDGAEKESELETLYEKRTTEPASITEHKVGQIKDTLIREPHETSDVVSSEGTETGMSMALKLEEVLPQKTYDTYFAEQHKEDKAKHTAPRQLDPTIEPVSSRVCEVADAIRNEELEKEIFPQKTTEDVPTTEENKEGEVHDTVLLESQETIQAVSPERPEITDLTTASKPQDLFPEQAPDYSSFTEHRKVDDSIAAADAQQGPEIFPSERHETDSEHRDAERDGGLFSQKFGEYEQTTEQHTEVEVKDIVLRESQETTQAVPSERAETTDMTTALEIGLKSGAPVNYSAQFLNTEAVALQLANTWTAEGGAVLSPGEIFRTVSACDSTCAEDWKSPLLDKEADEIEALPQYSGTAEPQQENIRSPGGAAMIQQKTTSDSFTALCDNSGIAKGTRAQQEDTSMDYASKFWDSEAIELQLTSMWTPEGGAVVVEDIAPDIIVPTHSSALLALQKAQSPDQNDLDALYETPLVGSLRSPENVATEENFVSPQSSAVPELLVAQVILEPEKLDQTFETEDFASPQAVPHKHGADTEQEPGESGAPQISRESQPIAQIKKTDALEPEYYEKETVDATSGSVEAGSSMLGTLPEPVRPPCTERWLNEAEDTNLTAEPVFKTEKEKPLQDSEQLLSDFIGNRLDSQVNDERGALLSVRRTEKHSCEKVSTRILKRYGDVQPMESVTEARENFVVSGTETQLFDDIRDSSTRNATEQARAECQCSRSKFESEVSFVDLSGKNVIEETNTSQPIYVEDLFTVDNIVKPLNAFDDIVTVLETSITGGLSWKQMPSDDMTIHVGSNRLQQSDSSCLDRGTEKSAKVSDDVNFSTNVSRCRASKLPNIEFSSSNIPSVPTFTTIPDAECTSQNKAGKYTRQLTLNARNQNTELPPGNDKSDISIKIERTSERSSSSSVEADALVGEMLKALQNPSLRVSDCALDQESVTASAVVTSGKSALSALTLAETGETGPLINESGTSESEWTQKTYTIYDTKESLKDLPTDAAAGIPPRRMRTDCKAASSQNDSVVQTTSARYQQEFLDIDDVVLNEEQARSTQNETLQRVECERVKASCTPNEQHELSADVSKKSSAEDSHLPALETDETSLSQTDDVQVLSDEQAKLLSTDIAPQAGLGPFKIGSVLLRIPLARISHAETSPPGIATSKQLESVCDQQARFHTKGPLTVQTEAPKEDYPGYPKLPPRLSCSDTEQEDKRSYVADRPFVTPIKKDEENGKAQLKIKQTLCPFVVRPTDDTAIDKVRQCPHTDLECDSGICPSAHAVFLSSPKIPDSESNAATRENEVGKTTPKKRKLSFSDEVRVSGEIFLDKREPLSGFSVTPTAEEPRSLYSKRRSNSGNDVASFPGRQRAYKNIPLAAVISEEHSQRKCEQQTAVERKSATVDDIGSNKSISYSAGGVSQKEKFSTIAYPQSVAQENTEAKSVTLTAENNKDGLKLPDYVDKLLTDTKFQTDKPKLSLSTESLGFSSEHVVNVSANVNALGEHREVMAASENKTWDSSAEEDVSTFLPGATCSSGDVTTERKTSLSSVSVGYSHERRASDRNGSYGEDARDSLGLVSGIKPRNEDSDSVSDKSRKDDFTATGSSNLRTIESPIPQEYTQTVDAEAVYDTAIVLRDDTFRVEFPNPSILDSGTEASDEYNLPVTEHNICESNDAIKQKALFYGTKNTPTIENAVAQCSTSIEPKRAMQDAPAVVESSERNLSEESVSDKAGCLTLLSKVTNANAKDDACDISREVPDVDEEPPKAVAHREELRFHNFRMVVERVADMSVGSEANIVYESFVPAQGRAIDTLSKVYHGAEFTVRTVDDYDVPAIMYDRWSEDATTVASTIKTFWTYSPHSFLLCANENGTHCGIISAIVFEDEQAFCTANSVKAEFVEEGVRRQLWDALLSVQQGKNLFSVVPAEQVNAYYHQLGFYSSARGLILHGKLAPDTDITPLAEALLPDGVEIVKFNKHMFGSLLSFDKSTLGFGRKRFWKLTLREGPISFRVALRGSERRVCGYAGLQNDVRGVPVVRWLVADDGQVALRLLHNLLAGSLTFRQRGAWMAMYARSHASAALLRHLDTSGFQPWMLVFNRREPFLQYKNIAVLTYI